MFSIETCVCAKHQNTHIMAYSTRVPPALDLCLSFYFRVHRTPIHHSTSALAHNLLFRLEYVSCVVVVGFFLLLLLLFLFLSSKIESFVRAHAHTHERVMAHTINRKKLTTLLTTLIHSNSQTIQYFALFPLFLANLPTHAESIPKSIRTRAHTQQHSSHH